MGAGGSMLGFLFLIGATIYEVYALVFKKQTISAFIWQLMEASRLFKTAFFLTWAWLTIHFLAPDFFR